MRAAIRYVGILAPAAIAAYIVYGIGYANDGQLDTLPVLITFVLVALIFAGLWSGYDTIIFRHQLQRRYGTQFTLNEVNFMGRSTEKGHAVVSNQGFPVGVYLHVDEHGAWQLIDRGLQREVRVVR